MKITLLDQAVRAANAEAGYKTLHHYVLFLHFAFDALYKMKRDGVMNNNAKFISMTMMANRITVPPNVLAVNKVGITVGRRIITAIPDNAISIDPENIGAGLDPGVPTSDVFSFLQFTSVYYQDFKEQGGIVDGSFFAPRYKRDGDDLIFDRGQDGAKVYLEVIETGVAPGASTIINHEAYLPIKSYIHHRHARFKLGASSAEARAALAEYDDELEEAIAAQSNLTGNAILNALSLRFRTY